MTRAWKDSLFQSRRVPNVATMDHEVKQLARRWCIWNAWGWPEDVPMVLPEDRCMEARQQMRKIETEIGITRCLAYWNSDEFDGAIVPQEYECMPPLETAKK